MATPSALAAKVVPAPVGQAAKAMSLAGKVNSFLELAPGLANNPANLAKIQKALKDCRNRKGARKGYCKRIGRVLVRIYWKNPRWVFGLCRAEKCQRGQTHVLVEEEKKPKDFLEGLLWLKERTTAMQRFGFCKTCGQALPDVEMHCADCVITSMLVHTETDD